MIRLHVGHQLLMGQPSPDVYFHPGYGRAASIADDGEWVLLEAFEGAWQVPLIVRTLADGTKDAISPVFSGVFAAPSLSSSQILAAWAATVDCLRQRGVISVVLRGSSLVPQASGLPDVRTIVRRPTIVLEPVDCDAAWSDMEGDCRTKIRKAVKNGYTGEVRKAESLDLAPGGEFRRLYEQTMRRVHAPPLYFFGENYYTELLEGMGSNLLIAQVRDHVGNVTSSSLLMRDAQRLHGHLTGSNVEDGRMGSNNLMIWTITRFAIDQGLRQFHLGSGVNLRDSLFKFKRSFGGRELEYSVSGVIIDHEIYQAQVQNRATECHINTDTLLASDFFPAYRAGIAVDTGTTARV